MLIDDITKDTNNPRYICVRRLITLEVTRERRKTYLTVTDAIKYMKWFEAYEKTSGDKWQRRHIIKKCQKKIKHLRLCEGARRNLYWKCYAFVKFETGSANSNQQLLFQERSSEPRPCKVIDFDKYYRKTIPVSDIND